MSDSDSYGHVPVLLDEAMAGLALRADGHYLDATFGRGGHAARILAALGPDGRLLLMDRDPEAVAMAHARFGADPRVAIRHESFDRMAEWPLAAAGLDGVLLDLGVSSPQLDRAERGFSFANDGPLDMRMDPGSGRSAAEFLASADEAQIADVLWRYGEERFSRRIARAIVAHRNQAPLTRTRELAGLIEGCISRREPGKHPATRSFQALRIFINDELGQLSRGLDAALGCLTRGGRLVAISFHSLEDRLVKHWMRDRARSAAPTRRGLPPPQAEKAPVLKCLGSAQKPTAAETSRNPRARSAVLRVAEMLA